MSNEFEVERALIAFRQLAAYLLVKGVAPAQVRLEIESLIERSEKKAS